LISDVGYWLSEPPFLMQLLSPWGYVFFYVETEFCFATDFINLKTTTTEKRDKKHKKE
jgi:hypothetical protein